MPRGERAARQRATPDPSRSGRHCRRVCGRNRCEFGDRRRRPSRRPAQGHPPIRSRGQGSDRDVLGNASRRNHDTRAKSHLCGRIRPCHDETRRCDRAASCLDIRCGANEQGSAGATRPAGCHATRIRQRRGFGFACSPPHPDFRVWRGIVRKEWRGSLRPHGPTAAGPGRPAPFQWRPVDRVANRRRFVGTGLRRRPAGRLSCHAPAGAARLWRGSNALGTDRFHPRLWYE